MNQAAEKLVIPAFLRRDLKPTVEHLVNEHIESKQPESLEDSVKRGQDELEVIDNKIRELQALRIPVNRKLRSDMGKLITKQLNEKK